MRTISTARIWIWMHDGPVRISVRKGQTLRHIHGGRDEEGYSKEGYSNEAHTWEFDGERLIESCHFDGRDCDGRVSRDWTGFTTPDQFKVRPIELPEYEWPGIPPAPPLAVFWPEWTEIKAGQRDFSAEAAGY